MNDKVTLVFDGKTYVPSYYDMSEFEVASQISDKIGVFTKHITEKQFYFTRKLIRDGWMLCDCYYGEKDKANKLASKLKARPSWFKFTGINTTNGTMNIQNITDLIVEGNAINDMVSDYLLYVNYSNDVIFLYDANIEEPSLIGTFHCYDDIIRTLKHIKRCIPARFTTKFNIGRYYPTDYDIAIDEDYADVDEIILSPFGEPYYEVDFNRLKEIAMF